MGVTSIAAGSGTADGCLRQASTVTYAGTTSAKTGTVTGASTTSAKTGTVAGAGTTSAKIWRS